MDLPIHKSIIHMVNQGMLKNRVTKISLLLVLLLCACGRGPNSKGGNSVILALDSLNKISLDWKNDSLGCMGNRNSRTISVLIKQLNLVGKDSITLINYLGKPDLKFRHDNVITFRYHMECGFINGSGNILSCRFENNTLVHVAAEFID